MTALCRMTQFDRGSAGRFIHFTYDVIILSWFLEASAVRIALRKIYISQSYVKLRSVNFPRLIVLWVLHRLRLRAVVPVVTLQMMF